MAHGLLASALLFSALWLPPAGAQQLVLLEHGTYSIHSLLHAIGTEEYTLTQAADRTRTLTATSAVNDRGSHRGTVTTLTLSPTGIPLLLRQQTVVPGAQGASQDLTIPAGDFAAFLATPAAVQMELLRFWHSRGEPASLPVVRSAPGSPTAIVPVQIRRVGHDAYQSHGAMIRLTRYTVDGLVFGREVLWMNDSNRLAAVMTFAGGLPAETVLDEYSPELGNLFHDAVQQEMLDLAELTHAAHPLAQGSYAIVGARLIAGDDTPPVEHSTVVIRDGRILSAGTQPPPPGLRVIHAEGQTLLPGLWEMHAHYSGVEFGPALLAAGITTARDCGGELEFLLSVRHAIDAEHQLGPHLLLAGLIDSGGPLAFGSTIVNTPEGAIRAVDLYADHHFQQIKVYDQVQPEVLRAITAEAHHRGLTVTGHIPKSVSTAEAIADGMDQINHLQYVTRALFARGALTPDGPVPMLNPAAEPARSFLKLLHDRQIVVDPTIGWGEMASHPRNLDPAAFEPGLNDAPWPLAAKFRAMGSEPGASDRWQTSQKLNLEVIRALFEAGVPVVAGSDTNLQGFGLDRELELYVQAGMTPLQAIQTATLVPARVMGLLAESGTVAPGKRADLLLVDGNPLNNISDLRRTRSVVTEGRMYSTAELGRLAGFRRSSTR